MIKIKVSEAAPLQLDWLVAKCEGVLLEVASAQYGCIVSHNCEHAVPTAPGYVYAPSINWSQGGPIIEREKIAVDWDHDCWNAYVYDSEYGGYSSGPTPLIAAMRNFIASKLGDEVEIPEELK